MYWCYTGTTGTPPLHTQHMYWCYTGTAGTPPLHTQHMLWTRLTPARSLCLISPHRKWLALWPVEHAVMLDCMGSDLDPSIKVSRPQCKSPSVIHTLPLSVSYLNDLWDSVRVTKTFRSCRPAWLEMDRKFCPTATTSLYVVILVVLVRLLCTHNICTGTVVLVVHLLCAMPAGVELVYEPFFIINMQQ